MTTKAFEALQDTAKIKNNEERLQAVGLWWLRWVVSPGMEVRVEPGVELHDLSRVLAQATHDMIERIALEGNKEKVIRVEPPAWDPKVTSYTVEIICIRHDLVPLLGMVPDLPPTPERPKKVTRRVKKKT